MSDISAVEVRFKKPINDRRKIEVVQGCVGEDYAQFIVVAVGMAQIQPGGTCDATAIELYKDMKTAKQLAGYNYDNNEDDDNNNDSVGLETSLGTVKHKQSSNLTRGNASTAARKVTGCHFVLTRKRKEGQKRPALPQMQALRKEGPSAVPAAAKATLRIISGRNTRTKPQARVP